MRIQSIVAGLLVCLAGSLQAGELAPAHVNANAKWVGHIDIEAIHDIQHVKKLHEKMMAKERVQAKIKEIKEKTGVDPTNIAKGITLYSNGYEGKQGVVLVYVRPFDRDKLNDYFMKKHPDHQTTEHNNRTIYSWTAKHKKHEMELAGTFANEEIVVVGCNVEAVKAALDVIDDESKGLTADAALVSPATKNDLMFVNAIDVPDEYSKTTRCPVLHVVSSATAQWQFADDTLNGHYELAARSQESADNMKAVIEGFKAMGGLRYKDVDAVLKVINSLTVNVQGQDVSIDFTASVGDLHAAVQQAIEYHKQHDHKKSNDSKKSEK